MNPLQGCTLEFHGFVNLGPVRFGLTAILQDRQWRETVAAQGCVINVDGSSPIVLPPQNRSGNPDGTAGDSGAGADLPLAQPVLEGKPARHESVSWAISCSA